MGLHFGQGDLLESQLRASGKDVSLLLKKERGSGSQSPYLSLPPVFLLWTFLRDNVLFGAFATTLQTSEGGRQLPEMKEQRMTP